jgi:hypothetical protein
MAKQEEKKPWHPSSKWLSFFLIAISVFYIISLYKINEKCEQQYNFNKEIKNESTQVKNPLTEIKPDTANKKFYLNEKDILELNNHIEYLTKNLETEVDRNQRNTEYNIDRLNLFMALGIGFLALIGGLLPVAVNFISKHDIDSKIKSIEDKLNESSATLKASEDKMPIIDMLILQNAVAKITSEDAWILFTSRNKPEKITLYFENIRLALEAFNDNSHSFEEYNIGNLSYFKNTISELKGALLSGPIRNINGKKDFQKSIDKLVKELHFFEVNEPSKFKAHLKIVSAAITELITLVENKTTA